MRRRCARARRRRPDPPRRTSTRSQAPSANERSCVASSVVPPLRALSRMTSVSAVTAAASSVTVASSTSSTEGADASAAASAALRRSPRESRPTRSDACSCSPSAATARSPGSSGASASARRSATCSATVSSPRPAGSSGTNATWRRAGRVAGPVPVHGHGATRRHRQARHEAEQGRLAGPVLAEERDHLAGVHLEVDVRERSSARQSAWPPRRERRRQVREGGTKPPSRPSHFRQTTLNPVQPNEISALPPFVRHQVAQARATA